MIQITCTAHEGLALTQNGETVWLAVLDRNGRILASGGDVAEAIENVAQASYLNYLKARGHEVVQGEIHEPTSPATRQQLAVSDSRQAGAKAA